jgi:predicted nucleic acid-binding protein
MKLLGFKQWDALHLACAESGQVDIFLTTDDKLLRLAHRVAAQLKVRVENPLTWLTEVTE